MRCNYFGSVLCYSAKHGCWLSLTLLVAVTVAVTVAVVVILLAGAGVLVILLVGVGVLVVVGTVVLVVKILAPAASNRCVTALFTRKVSNEIQNSHYQSIKQDELIDTHATIVLREVM